tara:strand:- start:802 stop:924 length:123 start_codon:yes stop_codon:yes gene_type:complete
MVNINHVKSFIVKNHQGLITGVVADENTSMLVENCEIKGN